jgi:glutamine synthetase
VVSKAVGELSGIKNIEIKSFDHTSNMYLALAMTIACAMDGLKKGLKLPAPIDTDPANLSE